MHHDHVRYPHDTADRCDVSNKIETEICVEGGVNRIRGANLQKGVAIGGCLHDRFGGDIAGSTWPVLDYELLAKPLREPLAHQALVPPAGKPTTMRTGRVRLHRATAQAAPARQ